MMLLGSAGDDRVRATATALTLAYLDKVDSVPPSLVGAALSIAALHTKPNDFFGGQSISAAWRDAAQQVGADAQAASSRANAASLVRQNLEAQRAAISGVSVDEESINLLNYQRQYQGAARFITVVDEMTQTLLGILG
jgi:flagellar hook-associated protein 1 FlgK